MYSDFLDRGINLAQVLPNMDESAYTPRLLLSLIENFGEGSALIASQLETPEARGWTKTHDLLIANYNAVMINTIVTAGVPKKDHKHFEFIESPIAKRVKELLDKAKGRKPRGHATKVSPLLAGAAFDQLDQLPASLRSKPKE